MEVKIDPNQNVNADGEIKISIEGTIGDFWKPLNFHYGCSGQLYYELNGYLHVIRDPENNPQESVRLRKL